MGAQADQASLANRVAFELERVRRRFQADLLPAPEFEPRTCPDRQIAADAQDEAQRTVVVQLLDQRSDRRRLLPLSVADRLRSSELAELRQEYHTLQSCEPSETRALKHGLQEPGYGSDQGGLQGCGEPGQDSPRTRGLTRLLAELEQLQRRRYLAVYHLTHFSAPTLILKIGETRRRWTAGLLRAWLVVYDVEQLRRPLCSTEVLVRTDPQDAPTSQRLRAETRERLQAELVEQVLVQSRERLAAMSHELRWPARMQGLLTTVRPSVPRGPGLACESLTKGSAIRSDSECTAARRRAVQHEANLPLRRQ